MRLANYLPPCQLNSFLCLPNPSIASSLARVFSCLSLLYVPFTHNILSLLLI
jgi:hypothetical protein